MNGSKAAVGAAEGIKAPHNVIMEDRHTLTVSGISDVDSFDEQTVIVFTDMGELTVKGEGLHINRLSLEVGEIMIDFASIRKYPIVNYNGYSSKA